MPENVVHLSSLMKPFDGLAMKPGGALDHILVGDVPARLQKHTCSLSQFFEKVYPNLYQFSENAFPTSKNFSKNQVFHIKILKIGIVRYTKIMKIDTIHYTNIWKIDTVPDGTSPYPGDAVLLSA